MRLSVVVPLVALILGACTAPGSSVEPSGSDAAPAASLPAVHIEGTIFEPVEEVPVVGGGPCGEGTCPIDEVMQEAIPDMDAFWQAEFAASFPGIPYTSPASYHAYGQGEVPATACAAESTAEDVANNAFYCSTDNSVAWYVPWFNQGLAQYGDFYPVAVTAHEWGHHLQALLTGGTGLTYDVQEELQADCFAGVYTLGAGLSGAFEFDPSDINEAAAFFQNGGSSTYPWFAPLSHGTSEQRLQAFNLGLLAPDATTCSEYESFVDGPVWELGPYTLATLNGAPASIKDDGITVEIRPVADSPMRTEVQQRVELTRDSALSQLPTLLTAWGGDSAQAVSVPEDLTQFATQLMGKPGTAAAVLYHQILNGEPAHGILIVHVSASGGGILLDTWEPGVAPTDVADWEALKVAAMLALSGLRVP